MKHPDGQPVKMRKTEWLKDAPIYQNEVCCPPRPAAELSLAQLHFHEFVEVSIVTQGAGIHCIWNRTLPCKKGDVYIVNAGVPHQYFAESAGAPLTVHNLLFDVEDWFAGPLADPDSPRYCCGVFEEAVLAAYAALNARQLESALRLCADIARETAGAADGWRELVQAYLTEFLVGVRRRMDAPRTGGTRPQDARAVGAVMRTVLERYAQPDLTLTQIAKELFLSKAQLSRVFYRVTGQHFYSYLRGVRLQQACRLLRQTALTNEQIVYACGMRDVPAFYQLFRAELGTTPYRYRTACTAVPIPSQTEKGDKTMEILTEISQNLQCGKAKLVKEQVQQALDAGIPVEQILNEGLLHGMGIIGEKFKNNEVYVPEVLVAARAMNMGAQVLKPLMAAAGVQATGRVCIGTVQGDLHDIGKNLVKMMMEGKGLEVIDLGTDVAPETFVQTAVQQDCQVICCSALLTTTMGVMQQVVECAAAAGIRDKVKIMIGGAPVTAEFCQQIGADKYTPDAASAADAAVAFCAAR